MNNIKVLQSFDPLSEAEKLTKKSYKEDKTTESLGFLLHLDKANQMNDLMESTDDTKFSESTEEYIRKITEFGFEKVYEESFNSKHEHTKYKTEMFYIYWHPTYSILLCFDTFWGNRNGGNFYYNWIPNDLCSRHHYTSSGRFETVDMKPDFSGELKFSEPKPKWNTFNTSWEDYKKISDDYSLRLRAFIKENGLIAIWSGDHDCREALKNNINLLVQNGTFLTKWYGQKAHLWLSHHGDNSSHNQKFDYDTVIQSRIEKLPDYIREAIGR